MRLAEKVTAFPFVCGITSPVWCWIEVGDVWCCVLRAENKAEILEVFPQSSQEPRSEQTEEEESEETNKKVHQKEVKAIHR